MVADELASSSDDDGESTRSDILSAPDVSAGGQPYGQHALHMANSDRPYNMYPSDESGKLAALHGALIPDGYKHDTTLPDRPWICPVRSCRRLFKSTLDLGNHFRGRHRGCCLNDNLDGTFSITRTNDNNGPAIVVSRSSRDFEEIAEPLRPTYPIANSKHIVWVKVGKDIELLSSKDDAYPVADDGVTQASARVDTIPDVKAVGSDVGIDMASADRRYGEWWDSNGKLVNMSGALLPEGYQFDATFPDRPWICPIRTCRAACKVRYGLGWHFTNCHRTDSLNDNGDGTFSVVGSHRGSAARVVSRNPLDPSEPPMAKPCLPGDAWERAAQLKKASMKPPSAVHSTSSTVAGGSNDPWKHICSQVEGQLPNPDTPGLKPLLNLPRVRDLVTTQALTTDLLPKQIAGLIIQVTGEESPKPCSECRRHKGPFATCVRSTAEVGHLTAGFLGTSCRACASCLYRKNSSACSLRSLSSLGFMPPPPKPALDSSFPWLSDTADAAGEDLFGRRRSARLSLANTHEDGDEGDGESLAGALADQRPRRIVTSKTRVPARSRNGSGTNSYSLRASRVALGIGNNIPAETDLQMENWEADDGRVTPIGNRHSEPLAFSSSYLAANQSVQVSNAIALLTVTISSGGVHRFHADSTKTRICSVMSGKLKIQVGDEPEFIIGSHGIFKISPGVSCSVVNRYYFDVVLHVTSLVEA
ncbi:Transcription factor SFP1 [Madurella mycetomatis]|uniref:Transcription factor SFP1 n=1 Tax=Madurella mycetomatis TaxID=100816 RepID=A0A175VT86_9PEZI|nr:Transcription factor SFP1 [Madurella mycetomatis]KXX83069.1 Transcription factor SFP1 [Madurella mycetomatis]